MTIEVEAIHQDASQVDGPDSVADMFLKRLEDAHGPSDVDDEEDLEAPEDEDEAEDEDADEDQSSEDDAEDEDEGTDEQDDVEDVKTPSKKRVATDDDVVTVLVDGAEVEIPVKDLKRLAGQEKALTRKAEEASEMKRQADENFDRYEASLNHHYMMAADAYKPYEGKNFNVLALAEGWDAATLQIVTDQEAAARRNLEYFHNELGSLHQTKAQTEQATRQKALKQTFAELEDPVHGIKGFGPDLIKDLDAFATQDLGLTNQDLADFVSHPRGSKIIKALNDLFAAKRGQKALELKTKKPAKAPVKMVKSPSEPASRGPDRHTSAIDRLRKDNSSDAIQNAFLARMNKR